MKHSRGAAKVTYLESACIGEGHMPWVGGDVHGVEVEGGLKLGLTTGQEHDAWHSWGHAPVEHLEGVVCHLHSYIGFHCARRFDQGITQLLRRYTEWHESAHFR